MAVKYSLLFNNTIQFVFMECGTESPGACLVGLTGEMQARNMGDMISFSSDPCPRGCFFTRKTWTEKKVPGSTRASSFLLYAREGITTAV